MTRWRVITLVSLHAGKALLAASTAALISDCVAQGTRETTSCVAYGGRRGWSKFSHPSTPWYTTHRVVVVDPFVCLTLHKLAINEELHCGLWGAWWGCEGVQCGCGVGVRDVVGAWWGT